MGFVEHVKRYRVYNTKTHKTFFIHGVIFYEYLLLVEFLELTQWTINRAWALINSSHNLIHHSCDS